MCILDLCNATIGCSTNLLPLWLHSELTSDEKLLVFTLSFVYYFLLNSLTYCITFITIDRYIHIKYPTYYPIVFSKRRFKIAIALALLMTFVQTAIGAILSVTFNRGKILRNACNFVVLFFNCVVYIRSRVILKRFEKRGMRLPSVTQNITRIATLYLLLVLCFKLVPVLIPITKEFMLKDFVNNKTNLCILSMMNIYGFLNTCIFLSINRTARRYLGELMFRRKRRRRGKKHRKHTHGFPQLTVKNSTQSDL